MMQVADLCAARLSTCRETITERLLEVHEWAFHGRES
jgi:hypothetical protein